MLIQSCQQLDSPLMDLPRQHSAALSAFADKHRRCAEEFKLQRPLVNYSVARSLMQNSWPTFSS